jgi:tRNA A-37 threonylcarbamoyl transferase component Bud32
MLAFPGEGAKTILGQPISPEAPEPALRPTVNYFGDYELLEEIARGGMGVVFKARQVSLNRIVAVKMILSGQLAGEAEVKRFRTEAEAAANLQHPNIVAIHEVGEHEGRHFFSMDYVEGANLANFIKDNPLSAIKAAEMLKTIAQAVHYAHQRGTLHRDLKPHNVLMDANAQPRITDFGLAKRIDQDSGLTQTGAVMGSPAYMPPEQAAGRQEQIGPPSDVYSLGAILYQLLTGKPPFAGATPLETIRQAMETEPVAPSKLNASLPSDLETICLKCLEKRPERRYHSARELAEELGRFLNQEPILAKPASAGRKTWNWLARHPWALTGTASILVLGLTGLAYGLWEQNRALIWSMAHGRAVKKEGDWADWLLVPSNFLGMPIAPWVFAAFVDCKRRNAPLSRVQFRRYGLMGVIEIIAALAASFCLIHLYVWKGEGPWVYLGWPFCVISPAWFGALLLWHLAAEARRTAFGVEQPRHSQLFPPKAPVRYTVEQAEAAIIFGLVVLPIFLAGRALSSEPWLFNCTGFCAACATGALLDYCATKTASRSLDLFVVILCGSLAAASWWLGTHNSQGVHWDAREGWAQSSALILGVASGWFYGRWKLRHPGNTPCVAWKRLWPHCRKKTALWAMMILIILLLIIFGPVLIILAPAATVCACFPPQWAIWRVSEGAEKRANSLALLLCVMVLATFILCHALHRQPMAPLLRQGLIGLGAGCLVLATLFLLEKRAAKKASLTRAG